MNLRPLLEPYENNLLLGAVGLYLLAMLSLWSQLFFHADGSSPQMERMHRLAEKSGGGLLACGAVLHGLSLVGQGSAAYILKPGVAGLFGWILAAAYALFGHRLGRNTLGAFVTPVVLLATLFSLTARGLHPRVPPEQLETQWQLFHVVLILVGYVSLAFAFAASLTYLLQEGLLKRKDLGGLWQRLPSLQVADDIIYRATAFGLGMLTLGLFIGVAWQRGYHPEYVPLRDPKVLFSLATWVTFMLYLASRLWLGWQGRRTNLVVVYGFVLLVISFFGAPHVLTGVAR